MARRERPRGDLFDDDYYRLLEPFHPEAEARYEVGAIRDLLGLSLDDRVLDLACGWGRHLRLLRQGGHDITGIDLSLPLLRRADGEDGLVCGNMLHLPFASSSFDVVLNLATSLGLFLDDDMALAALAEARRVLRPGGLLLIEGMHRDDVVARFAERDEWTLGDGTRIRARRRFDPLRGISHEVLRWRRDGGGDGEMDGHGAGSKCHSLRLRTGTEIAALLEGAGFVVEGAWGDWDGSAFRADSPRLLVRAARPSGKV